MSQRDSGYDRIPFDQYETPAWATFALVPHIVGRVRNIWEPACGSGKMVEALMDSAFNVRGTDIQTGHDFTNITDVFCESIVTNPPYSAAAAFISNALNLTRPLDGLVAMLLRCDFDHAKGRADLFANHPAFAKKIILTKRIRWIEGSKGSPSFNHAWFVWDWQHTGKPTIEYSF